MALGLEKNQSNASTLVWLRRDLRLTDHAALAHALSFEEPIAPIFMFDREILDPLPKDDRRVAFIHRSLQELNETLIGWGGGLIAQHGWPRDCIPSLATALNAARVIAAHDYEPSAIARDNELRQRLEEMGVDFITVKDQCIFETTEVLTQAARPFSVFTPYKNAWLKSCTPAHFQEREAGELLRGRLLSPDVARPKLATRKNPMAIPSLEEMGFAASAKDSLRIPTGESGANRLFEDFVGRIQDYKEARDFPAIKGPSYLSVHLRFGTLSIRKAVRMAHELIQAMPGQSAGAQTWLSELIWRDFYMQILANFPHVVERSFRPEYDAIEWRDHRPNSKDSEAKAWFEAWCKGQTGYPLVDAAMRQLNETGYMHNRLRMVTASFLTKDLGIHWKAGEAYFAEKLLDFDLSANNGGWQWAASTGCDAQPYFRIFNPVSQSEKFDPKGAFIRRYVPELAQLSDKAIHAPWSVQPELTGQANFQLGRDYPHPVVDHDVARRETLARFDVVKKKERGLEKLDTQRG